MKFNAGVVGQLWNGAGNSANGNPQLVKTPPNRDYSDNLGLIGLELTGEVVW
jgi:hypothetical protein